MNIESGESFSEYNPICLNNVAVVLLHKSIGVKNDHMCPYFLQKDENKNLKNFDYLCSVYKYNEVNDILIFDIFCNNINLVFKSTENVSLHAMQYNNTLIIHNDFYKTHQFNNKLYDVSHFLSHKNKRPSEEFIPVSLKCLFLILLLLYFLSSAENNKIFFIIRLLYNFALFIWIIILSNKMKLYKYDNSVYIHKYRIDICIPRCNNEYSIQDFDEKKENLKYLFSVFDDKNQQKLSIFYDKNSKKLLLEYGKGKSYSVSLSKINGLFFYCLNIENFNKDESYITNDLEFENIQCYSYYNSYIFYSCCVSLVCSILQTLIWIYRKYFMFSDLDFDGV